LAEKEQKARKEAGLIVILVEKIKNQVVRNAVPVVDLLPRVDLKEKDIRHAGQPRLLAAKKVSGAKSLRPKRKGRKGRKNENYKITFKTNYSRRA
jgi:hypothetical protein